MVFRHSTWLGWVGVRIAWTGLLVCGLAFSAAAGTLTLKVRAINKSQANKQPVEVRAALPRGATPDTVIDAGGLEVAYDVATKGYYVHKTIDIEPGQTRTFDVVLKDVWIVPDETLRELGDHAKTLSGATQGSEQAATAQQVAALIDGTLKTVTDRQRAFAIGAVKPVDHIRAYESNMQSLDQARKDMGVLENLVIAAGKDPGKILGVSRVVPPEPDVGSRTDRIVAVRIKVTNPSLTEKKTPALRRDLPAEVKPNDIVDAGGLEVGFDAARGVCYVYSEAVEIPPQQSREFEVRVRNPWAGTEDYQAHLKTRVDELKKVAKETEAYPSVLEDIERLSRDLVALSTNKPPATLNEEYVAFSRRQRELLRDAEGRVTRMEELFQPREKPHPDFGATMLNVKPPSRENTWRIIWIILIFLAAFSALFFLRWYGRSKAETLGRTGAGNQPPAAPGAGPTAA